MKKVTVQEIINTLGNDVCQVYGTIEGKFIDNLADTEHTTSTTLDWIKASNKKKKSIVEQTPALTIIVDERMEYTQNLKEQGKTLILVKKPRNAIAKIALKFFTETHVEEGVHPTAIIHPEAVLEDGVRVGPYSVIGKAFIGANTQINSGVKIYDGVRIGASCFIDSGVVLGGQGFGYEKDENGNHFRFPQIGKLIIGDHVDIGANTCIDRGALSDTIVGDYTKIDNLCHIAHNNQIGRNCVITAGTVISGSCEIGDNTWLGPNSTINNWCGVGDNCLVGIGTVVIRKIEDDSRVFGVPAEKIEF